MNFRGPSRRAHQYAKMLVACGCLLCGCEDLPDFGYEGGVVEPNAVTANGSKQYEWTWDGRSNFRMRKPLQYDFFQQVDRQRISEAVRERRKGTLQANERVWGTRYAREENIPQQISNATLEILARITEGHLPVRPLLELDIGEQVFASGFDLDWNAKFFVTVGSQPQVWDVDKSEMVQELPFEQVKGAAFAGDSGAILLQQNRRLMRVDGSTGELLATFEAAADIVAFDCDFSGESTAVLLADGSLVALGPQMKEVNRLKAGTAMGDSISMHPKGLRVIVNSAEGPLQWPISGLVSEPQVYEAVGYNPDAICESGEDVDFWIGSEYCHSVRDGELLTRREEPGQILFPQVLLAETCVVEKAMSWTLVVARQPDAENNWKVFLQDHRIEDAYSSLPMPLDFYPVAMSSSRDGSSVALADGEQIQVFHRRPLVDPIGDFTADELASLAVGGRSTDFEYCLGRLSQCDWLRAGVDPRELIYEAISRAGRRFGEIHRTLGGLERQVAERAIQRLEQWRESGSSIGRAVSAVRFVNLVHYASSTERENLLDAARKDLAAIETDELLAGLVLELRVESAVHFEGANEQQLSPMLAAYVKAVPTLLGAHEVIVRRMESLVTEQVGTGAERFSYTSAVADLYPPPEDDYVFTLLTLDVAGYSATAMYADDPKRFYRGLQEMISRKELRAHDLRPIYMVYRNSHMPEMLQAMDEYAVRNLGSLPSACYILGIPQRLVAARNESRRLANEKAAAK